jgi:dipeptidyl aminopeptidase/acylaminoacyl peptidase
MAPRLAPSVLDDGLEGKLAIQATWGGEIYIYDLASGALASLTGGFDPAISPDGERVVFTRDGGENGIYIVDIDGSDERLIFSGRGGLRSPKWSSDGHFIVFERSDESSECRLDDSGRCLPDSPRRDHLPRALEWQAKLSRVDENGENFRDLAVLNRAHAPDWNEAGIVYHSPAGIQVTEDRPDARSRVVYFDVQKQYELDPDWQRDGGRILFQQREASHWEIYSVAPDGSGLMALTRPPFAMADELPSNVAPAWSPDGRHIVFLSNRGEGYSVGEWGIWVMDADGGNQRRLPIEVPLTYTYVAEQMVDWGP